VCATTGWRDPAADDLGHDHRPSGRTLSGQTIRGVLELDRATPARFAVGLNCALGAEQLRPTSKELSRMVADGYVSATQRRPAQRVRRVRRDARRTMGRHLGEFAETRFVNIVGGCCGTTPDHIRAIAERSAASSRRARAAVRGASAGQPRLSGLEPLTIDEERGFVNMVGERTNVTGSRRSSPDHGGRLRDRGRGRARQVENGAQIIDVNMDEGLLDSEQAMTTFLNLIAAEPDIAACPIMIDSSKWEVIEAGLKCVQGKASSTRSASRRARRTFLEQARTSALRRRVVVMAFDENRQAETAERKVEICERAYRLLTEKAGFAPKTSSSTPTSSPSRPGIEEHDNYAVDFIEATREIKKRCPGAKVSGRRLNISFSLPRQQPVREAMHSAFLYHAIRAGMDMGIVNAGQLAVYDDIPEGLLEHVEDVCSTAARRDRAAARPRRDRVKGGGKKRRRT
jgi:5-methyltetrahydrofolate--homocysteine methyltransferase